MATLLARRPTKIAAIVLANEIARLVGAKMGGNATKNLSHSRHEEIAPDFGVM
jgi:hypothetical protein